MMVAAAIVHQLEGWAEVCSGEVDRIIMDGSLLQAAPGRCLEVRSQAFGGTGLTSILRNSSPNKHELHTHTSHTASN
jgi:hypothetical protein